ncbi:MAG: M23 family metallopeptidase [Clostridiales bacterium]|nr:M23 family metallopeptidase [Clostridiales bacterium]
MSYPVPSTHSISAGFPNYSSGSYHGGIDFPCSTGSKVCAAQKGIVITVKRLTYSYGYYVMIYHGTDSQGRSVVTLYAHNSSILVSVGDTVEKGEQIAKSGSTGNSTGPHCHFEVRLNGTRVNPLNYIS